MFGKGKFKLLFIVGGWWRTLPCTLSCIDFWILWQLFTVVTGEGKSTIQKTQPFMHKNFCLSVRYEILNSYRTIMYMAPFLIRLEQILLRLELHDMYISKYFFNFLFTKRQKFERELGRENKQRTQHPTGRNCKLLMKTCLKLVVGEGMKQHVRSVWMTSAELHFFKP